MIEPYQFITTDRLVNDIQRRLSAQGVAFEDIDERIAAELCVPLDQWCGYLAVISAADRYQSRLAAEVWRLRSESMDDERDMNRLTLPDAHQRTGG